jgi:hypothetical protein
MTKQQLIARATDLEAMAAINDAYERAIYRTYERSRHRSSTHNAPIHAAAAAQKRRLAADLRAQAEAMAS